MIRLENILKISLQEVFIRLEDVFKTSWKHLEDVLKTFLQDVLKTFWTRLENFLKKPNIFVLNKASWRRLHQDECLVGCWKDPSLSPSHLNILGANLTLPQTLSRVGAMKLFSDILLLQFINPQANKCLEMQLYSDNSTKWIVYLINKCNLQNKYSKTDKIF